MISAKEYHDYTRISQEMNPNLKKHSHQESKSGDIYLSIPNQFSHVNRNLSTPALHLTIANYNSVPSRKSNASYSSNISEIGHVMNRLFPSTHAVIGNQTVTHNHKTVHGFDQLSDPQHTRNDSPPPSKMETPRNRLRNRLMQQDGDYNISMTHVQDSMQKYYSDLWTTIIEVKWRWALLLFGMSFTLSWLVFSAIYYCIMYAHGDFENRQDDWKKCIVSVDSFAAVFMFSLETQTTIGYGFRYPSDECPEVIYTMCLQSMWGVVIQTLLVGVVFAKMARPNHRANTIQFSRCAVITLRERRLCFMFRMGDLRKTHLANISLRAFMIRKHVTPEGEILPFYIREMKCKVGDVDGCPLLAWPVVVCHVIDRGSPLYEISRGSLRTAKFEIHIILDGVTPTNGMTTTARTSYVPSEIHWGCRLDCLITYQTEQGEYRVDYSKFHDMSLAWTPSCSAKRMDEMFVSQTGCNNDLC